MKMCVKKMQAKSEPRNNKCRSAALNQYFPMKEITIACHINTEYMYVLYIYLI